MSLLYGRWTNVAEVRDRTLILVDVSDIDHVQGFRLVLNTDVNLAQQGTESARTMWEMIRIGVESAMLLMPKM
jgi:hypothetical protein